MKNAKIKFLSFVILFVFIFSNTAYAIDAVNTTAAAAIIADEKSDIVLYEKNSLEKMYPASTTKIMTALLTLEKGNLSDIVTISQDDFQGIDGSGSSADLKEGENVTVETLLYCLMLPSANEAANALARYVSGSIDEFVVLMNERAAALGCKNTHFANPNGLHDDNHYTCAYDLYLIAKQAMTNETFCEIANTAQKTLPATNMHEERKVYTTNQLILRKSDPTYYSNCIGIKTGHTTPAGYCFVSAASKKDSTIISVVLNCTKSENSQIPTSFTETIKLFDWAFDNYTYKTLVEKGYNAAEIPVRLSTDKDYIVVSAADSVSGLVPVDIDLESLTFTKNVPESVNAPIKSGDVIGSMTISNGDVSYGTVDLVAISDVEMSTVLYYVDKLENFFKSTLFFVILAIIIFIIILIFIIRGVNRRRRKKGRMQKNYGKHIQNNDRRRGR